MSALHPDSNHDVRKGYDDLPSQFVPLASWAELQSNRNCSTCSRIANLFEIKLKDHVEPSATYQLLRFCNNESRVALSLSRLPDPRYHYVYLSLEMLDERFLYQNPNWLDLNKVSKWIKVCDTTHTRCHCTTTEPSTAISSQNAFFISVSRRCIIKAHLGERYIALSYVWGPQLSQLGATRANFPFLRSEGSLSWPQIWERIPGTIQRAMKFASMLEVDLLWVDRLCIVQDDPVHTASQINSMASVYSNAYFTLCAADGTDANSGLQGIPGSSKPRNLQQDIFAFHGVQSTVNMARPIYQECNVYDERAWTLQETVLSTRTLAFRHSGLYWRCQTMLYAEQDRAHIIIRSMDQTIRHCGSQWPSVDRWASLVFNYQQRRMTYEHDALRAFSGILEAMSEYMPGGFHFGLPELFFDMALLWIPYFYLTRREGAAIGDQGFAFPSWSWAGWRGELTGHFRYFEHDYKPDRFPERRKPRIGHLIPSVKWFKIRTETSELSQVCNDYDRYRDSELRGDVELPPGWSSHLDKDSGRKYYVHHMNHSCETFWYPLPTTHHLQPADKYTYQSVLFCRTWEIRLELGSALVLSEKLKYWDGLNPVHWVTTEDSKCAGILYVHRGEDSMRQNQQCELVVISSSFVFEVDEKTEAPDEVRRCFPELDCPNRPRSGDRYHYYNLLWIEWQDGIPYRKGLARVAKSVYDDLPKEEIDLYLG